MAHSIWRLYDTQSEHNGEVVERLMRDESILGIGRKSPSGATVDLAWTKTEVTRLARKAKYKTKNNKSTKKVPPNTPMGNWIERPAMAESLGVALFFLKHSKDGRYRIELEVNFA